MSATVGLDYDVDGDVAQIRFNRPRRKNALTIEMIDGLAAALRAAGGDPGVRAVLICGADGSFCSGIDLSLLGVEDGRLTEPPLHYRRILTDHIHQIAFAFDALDKPVIAAIAGSAVGAGLDIALMCDLRIAGASARLAESYIKVGLVPGAGGCHFLPRIVGRAKALEMLLTGDVVDADEALRIGLVNRVVPDDALDEKARELAVQIASGPPISASLIKRAVRASEGDLTTSLDLISSHMALVSSTRDTGEAITALSEKRAPSYRGE
jgi:enoyl-CoA hydratase/carnithine racemase